MCSCGKHEALQEAMIAVDGSIQALVMARIILDKAMKGVDKPVDKVVDTHVHCEHPELIDISTMGNMASMCRDCGENL